eukprot:6207554-Pleurochrysis_carterae.AAC.3
MIMVISEPDARASQHAVVFLTKDDGAAFVAVGGTRRDGEAGFLRPAPRTERHLTALRDQLRQTSAMLPAGLARIARNRSATRAICGLQVAWREESCWLAELAIPKRVELSTHKSRVDQQVSSIIECGTDQ